VGATLARHVAIYGVSTLLVQSVSLVTAPVFTRHFGPARFGILDVTGASVALAITVSLAGLDGAVARAYVGAPSEAERQTVVSTGLAAVVTLGSTLALAAVLLAGPVSVGLFGDRSHTGLVMAAALGVPVTVAAGYTRRLLRLQSRPGLFLVSAVTLAFVGSLGAMVLAIPVGLGLPGVYLGIALGAAVALGVSTIASRHLIRWRFSVPVLVEMAAVGLPLALFGLSLWAIRMLDRFILVRAVDLRQLGFYAAANRVAAILLLGVGAFEGAWLPVLLRTEGTGDAAVTAALDRALPWFAAASALVGAGLAAFSSEILVVVAGDRFQPAASVVPPLVLAMLFHATTPVTTSVLIVARRTGGLALGALGAVAVNVAACLVLVPVWGITGAAWATVLGFAYRAEDCRRRAAR
jgi:O-antigen/teichoic acid export membrane protein